MHRLAHNGLSVRKIAATLGLSRPTVQKYLDDPTAQAARPTRASKLDPFKDDIARQHCALSRGSTEEDERIEGSGRGHAMQVRDGRAAKRSSKAPEKYEQGMDITQWSALCSGL
ncbi:MAG TPA: helix-turn-helix domain-containing protein [Candidatus Entotheonella sp.]|jgi:predicted transcriptional regulator